MQTHTHTHITPTSTGNETIQPTRASTVPNQMPKKRLVYVMGNRRECFSLIMAQRPRATAQCSCSTERQQPGLGTGQEVCPGACAGQSCSSSEQLCPAALHGDTGRFVPHRETQAWGAEGAHTVPVCAFILSYSQRLTVCSLCQPRSDSCEFFLHSKWQYRKQRKAMGNSRTGWHSAASQDVWKF